MQAVADWLVNDESVAHQAVVATILVRNLMLLNASSKQGSAHDLLGGLKERYHFAAVESIDDVYSVTRPLSIDYLENRFNLDRNSCGKRGKSNRAAGVVTITFLTVNLMD